MCDCPSCLWLWQLLSRQINKLNFRKFLNGPHIQTNDPGQILPPSIEAASPQVVCDYYVRDGIKDELDILRVGGAGHVAIDLFGC